MGHGRWRIHPYSKVVGSLKLHKVESNPHLEIEEDEVEVLDVKGAEGFETGNSFNNKDSETRSSVSSAIQGDEEDETSSHGYIEIQDGTQENGTKSTTLHEDVRDAQECPSVDIDQDEIMSENSTCESDNATEDDRGNECFDILGSEATSEPDMWNLEDCNQPELPCIASADNWSSRSDSWQESQENGEDKHQDSEEYQHGTGDGHCRHGERQDNYKESGQSQDKVSEMPKSELEDAIAHMAETKERKCKDSERSQTEDFHLLQKNDLDLTNNEVTGLLPHANPAKDKDDYSQLDSDSDIPKDLTEAKDEDEDLPREEDEDTVNNEDLSKDKDGDLATVEDSDTANKENENLPRDEAGDLPKDDAGDLANKEDEELAKHENSDQAKDEDEDVPKCSDVQKEEDSKLSNKEDFDLLKCEDFLLPTNYESALLKDRCLDLTTEESELPKRENPDVPKDRDAGQRENEVSDQKEKNGFGATESVSSYEEQATKNPELDEVSEVMKNPEANKSETEELAIQPSERKLRRRKVKSSKKVMGSGKGGKGRENVNGKYFCESRESGSYSDVATSCIRLRLKVKVDVTDSNPIVDQADICFDSHLKVLEAKPLSSFKPCFVRLARMDKISNSILRQIALENSRL